MNLQVNGKQIEARGLTRGEIKKLRKEGIVLTQIETLEDEKRDAALDRIFGIACPGLDPDEITPGQALELFISIIGLCYGREDLVKKSDAPPQSTSPRGGLSAENAGAPVSRPRGTARKSRKRRG